MTAVCLEDIVGKEDIRDLVLCHIGDNILREITGVDDMYLLEGEEQITRQHIAEAVLKDNHTTTVMRGGTHLCEFSVTTHHRTIGTPMSILELKEERCRKRLTFTCHLIVFVDGIVGIGRSILYTLWNIIYKILRSILDGDILRIAIHAAHIAMCHPTLIMREVLERNTSDTCKLLCGIITTER